MKYADAWAALDHYDLRRVADDHGERRTLPEDPSPVHALFRPPVTRIGLAERRWDEYGTHAPTYLESYRYEDAACEKYVKVVLSVPFEDDDPDACPGCVAEAARRAENPEAWWKDKRRRRYVRSMRREEREQEQEDAMLWRQREWERREMDEWARRPDLRVMPTSGLSGALARLPRVKVKYRFSLDDPAQARERRFVRDEDGWPFPSLPALGDAVVIEAPGLPPLEGRPVDRVMYRAATAEAVIDLRADGLNNDVEAQVAVLREMGFREI